LDCSASYKERWSSSPKPFGIAKSFDAEVERFGGAESAAPSFKPNTQLVEAKLEMVRAAWLLQHADIVCRFCWVSRLDRVQRGEID
jgi:hypothetical protein